MNVCRLVILFSFFCSAVVFSNPKINPMRLKKSEWASPKSYEFLGEKNIVAISELCVEIFSRKNGRLKVREFLRPDVKNVIFGKNGSVLGALKGNGLAVSNSRRKEFFLDLSAIIDARFSPDIKSVALINKDEIRLYDLESRKTTHSHALNGDVFRIGALSNAGDKAILVNNKHEIWLFDASREIFSKLSEHTDEIIQTTFSSNEDFVLSLSKSGTLLLTLLTEDVKNQEIASGALAFHLLGNGELHYLTFTGDIYKITMAESMQPMFQNRIPAILFYSLKTNHIVPLSIKSAKWANPHQLLVFLDNQELLLFDLGQYLPEECYPFAERGFLETSFDLIRLALEPFIHHVVLSRL